MDDVVRIPEQAVAQAREAATQALEIEMEALEFDETITAFEKPREVSPPENSVCLICQHGFHWPTAYWPSRDEYGNWFHFGCEVQPRPYMAINQEEQWWGTAGSIWWEVYCEGK